jgi:hypothetical protein
MSKACSTHEIAMNIRFLVGKPEGHELLERSRLGWEDNIKIDLRETGWKCGLTHLGQYSG